MQFDKGSEYRDIQYTQGGEDFTHSLVFLSFRKKTFIKMLMFISVLILQHSLTQKLKVEICKWIFNLFTVCSNLTTFSVSLVILTRFTLTGLWFCPFWPLLSACVHPKFLWLLHHCRTGGNLMKLYQSAWPNAYICSFAIMKRIHCNMFCSKVMALMSSSWQGHSWHSVTSSGSIIDQLFQTPNYLVKLIF